MPLVAHPASKGGHGGRDLLWSSIVSRRKLSLEAERTNDLPVDITERVIPEHFSWGSSLQRAQLRRGHAVPVAPVARSQGVDGGGGGEHFNVNANSALQGRRDFCACSALNQGCAKARRENAPSSRTRAHQNREAGTAQRLAGGSRPWRHS